METPTIYTLSLHDALPILSIEGGYQENLVVGGAGSIARRVADDLGDRVRLNAPVRSITQRGDALLIEASDVRSEEHTSELQSRFDIVCRLLLEKKKLNKVS